MNPAFLSPVKNGLIAMRRFWAEQLGQGDIAKDDAEIGALLSVPFVVIMGC